MRRSPGGIAGFERAMRPNLMASAVWKRIADTASEKIRLAPIGLTISLLIPLAALALQWVLWPWIKPFVWFFFFPAVFLSARIGGLRGGLPATAFSILLVWYFFIPPQLSWHIENPNNYWSMALFLVMGWLFSDVQERLVHAYERIEQNNNELKAVNKELEAFSYSVSHDLRAPLRAIDGFSQVLQEDYAEHLDEAGRDCTARIRRSAQNMGALIDDMLDLSRITRIDLNRSYIDLSALAQEIADTHRASAPDRKVEFEIADGIKAHGDSHLLRIALNNLLNNAWKFSAGRSPAHIEFGQKRIDGETAYYVRDNGAGFDMVYAGKLFGAFQRLHDVREYPGTGIGLATVQRVINKHGGRVWAEAEPDKGATFCFTL